MKNQGSILKSLLWVAILLAAAGLGGCGGGGGPAQIVPITSAPIITVQPQSQTVTAPATATFTVRATGYPTPNFQWNQGGVPIAGATSASWTTPATTAAMNGNSYTVTVANDLGAVTSSPAVLTVVSTTATAAPAFTWDGTVVAGEAINYTQGSYLQGFEFTANSTITVTQLGAYDSNLASLPSGTETFAAAPVGLYDITTNTLLGSVTVQPNDPATGAFRYATLATPIALNTTDTYAVVWASGSDKYVASFNADSPLVPADVNPAINYLGYAGLGNNLQTTTVLVQPDFFIVPNLNEDLGPNFMFTTSI